MRFQIDIIDETGTAIPREDDLFIILNKEFGQAGASMGYARISREIDDRLAGFITDVLDENGFEEYLRQEGVELHKGQVGTYIRVKPKTLHIAR